MEKNNSGVVSFGSIVKRTDGKIDRAATLAVLTERFNLWAETQEGDQDKLLAAVHALFDKHPDKKFNTPAVINLAVNQVGCSPENYQDMQERGAAAIKSDPRFYVVRGNGGGLARMNEKQYATFQETGKNPAQLAAEAAAAKKAQKKSASTTSTETAS